MSSYRSLFKMRTFCVWTLELLFFARSRPNFAGVSSNTSDFRRRTGAAQKVEVPLTPHYWCGELFQVLLFSWSLEGEWGCLQNTILLLIVGAFNTNTLSLQNVKVSLLGRIAEANNFLNFRLRTNSSSPSGLYPYLYTYTYTYPYPCITFSYIASVNY